MQKQALNALVFFFREVCGMEQVDLEVRLRKTERVQDKKVKEQRNAFAVRMR